MIRGPAGHALYGADKIEEIVITDDLMPFFHREA